MAREPEVFSLDSDDSKPARVGGRITVVETEAPFKAVPEVMMTAPRRGAFWWRAFWSALGGFIVLALSVAAYDFVVGLLVKWPPLGYLAMALAGLAVVALVVVAGRELIAVSRLGSAAAMRRAADAAFDGGDAAAARETVKKLIGFYSGDPSTARARAALEGHLGEIIDAPHLIGLAERELLRDKDEQARAAIGAAASKVAMVTTISPRAWVDVGFVLTQSFMLISKIAAIYSGRPGGLAVWRLSARVAQHLAITGGIAVAHDAIGQFVGAGLVGRLSSKLGEGVLNGVLTARVGLSAIAVCRPMAFRTLEAPALADVAGSLLTPRNEPAKPAG